MLKINNEDIEGIYLLSEEEAQNIPSWILACGGSWWLRSALALYSYGAWYVNGYYGYLDNDDYSATNLVRPAFSITNLDNQGLEIGETVKVLGRIAQYIGNNSVLLCDGIGERRFDGESNDYEKSEIKRYIESWLAKELKKVRIINN